MPDHSPLVAIRREDKNIWERRAPLIPEQVGSLIGTHNISFAVERSPIRVFNDAEYEEVGAELLDSVANCPLILGVKEMPLGFFRPGGTYVFFSHVIKGQPHNMPMLRRLLELGCTLIDYEKMTDDSGRRLVFFGRFAGMAGITDTIAGLGIRLRQFGWDTPFQHCRTAHEYGRVELARAALAEIGRAIAARGLPRELSPLVIGVTGYGHVAQGVWEMLDALNAVTVNPDELPALVADGSPDRIYRTMFREEHLVTPVDPDHSFNLSEYYSQPERYRARFEEYLPWLSALANCIYWDPRYPRLVTRDWLHRAFTQEPPPRLKVIGDISCDVNGSIEATVRTTDPGQPFFTYNPATAGVSDGIAGPGIVIMAVDNLPCEFPFDSSREFGQALMPFVPPLAHADFRLPLDRLDLPGPLRRAVIVHQGRLTPAYAYIEEYLQRSIS